MISGNLDGVTLAPGVYCLESAAMNLTSTLTFSGSGQYILRFADTFNTSSGSRMLLNNGASCGDIAYQVGSSGTFAGSLVGNVIVNTTVTMVSGGDLNGRVLTRHGAITMTGWSVSNAGCN